MTPSSTQTYVCNVDQIARLFFPEDIHKPQKHERNKKKCIAWKDRPDFPAKVSENKRIKGWRVVELLVWRDRYVEEITRESLVQKAINGDADGEGLTVSEFGLFDKLRKKTAAQAQSGQSGFVEDGAHGVTRPTTERLVTSITTLAGNLDVHFKGQTTYTRISKQLVKNWQNGNNRYDAPPPPECDSAGRHDTQLWIEWIQRHLWKHIRKAEGQTTPLAGIIDYAALEYAQFQEDLAKLEDAKKLRDIANRKFCEVEVVARLHHGVSRTISARHNAGEQTLPTGLDSVLKELGLPDETRLLILQKFRPLVVRWNEDFQTSCATELAKLMDDKLLFPG